MADRTKIANRILAKVGSARITDYNDPEKESARAVRDVFDQCLEQLLDSGNWATHKKQEDLAQLLATPNHKWAYQYQLPTDFLRIASFNQVDVFDEQFTDFFDIQGSLLLTDEETVDIEYIHLNLEVSLLKPNMVTALIFLVASEVAVRLRQDEALSQNLLALYEGTYLPRARRVNATQKKTRQWNPCAESRLVRSRYQSTAG